MHSPSSVSPTGQNPMRGRSAAKIHLLVSISETVTCHCGVATATAAVVLLSATPYSNAVYSTTLLHVHHIRVPSSTVKLYVKPLIQLSCCREGSILVWIYHSSKPHWCSADHSRYGLLPPGTRARGLLLSRPWRAALRVRHRSHVFCRQANHWYEMIILPISPAL